MRKILKILIFSVFVFALGINNCVKAEKISSQDGYARCVYGGTVMDGTVSSNVAVVIRVYKDTGGVVRSYANMRCSDTYNEMATGAAEMRECGINNYNDIFHHASEQLYPSFGDGGWKCPGKIYVNVVPQYPGNGGNISINESSGYTALNLNNDYSKTETGAVAFESDDDNTGDFMRVPSLSESLHDNIVEGGDDASDDASILDAILNWGKKDDSTKYGTNAADPCDLISGEIQGLLHDIFFMISIAGIIILVVMTAISLVKIITASEDNALSNFVKGLWKRIICLIILLLLPMLITFIIQIVNDVAPSLGIKSNNPLCDITK